jgi:hypothetical protein
MRIRLVELRAANELKLAGILEARIDLHEVRKVSPIDRHRQKLVQGATRARNGGSKVLLALVSSL